jgi:hypothetical protein
VQDNKVSDNDGSGLEETCDGVKWGCSHGGEDGWGCCGGMRDGLEEGGKRGSDCSINSVIITINTHCTCAWGRGIDRVEKTYPDLYPGWVYLVPGRVTCTPANPYSQA